MSLEDKSLYRISYGGDFVYFVEEVVNIRIQLQLLMRDGYYEEMVGIVSEWIL